MATNAKIKSDIQTLNVGSRIIELFTLDATSLGGSVYRFTPMTEGGSNVVFGGITYNQLPCEFTGLTYNGDGSPPRPKLRVANVNLTFVALVNAYNDGLGAKVTRLRTLEKYIDSQPGADSAGQWPLDVFYIEQKTLQNKHYIEWELVVPYDIGEIKLPRLQVLSTCQHRYRLYSGGGLVYTNASCPYSGSSYFDAEGNATTIDLDDCGKKLSDCELRYPNASDQLPFKGFPGIGQIPKRYR